MEKIVVLFSFIRLVIFKGRCSCRPIHFFSFYPNCELFGIFPLKSSKMSSEVKLFLYFSITENIDVINEQSYVIM